MEYEEVLGTCDGSHPGWNANGRGSPFVPDIWGWDTVGNGLHGWTHSFIELDNLFWEEKLKQYSQ